jgi:hypothetical protein
MKLPATEKSLWPIAMERSAAHDQMQAKIERVLAVAPDAKALYREAAAMLFYRFGIAPMADHLHQLVGKGSTATAASAVSRFWQDLRKQGRLRIEHPAVPEPLRDAAGAVIGEFWKLALCAAEADLPVVRQELDLRVQAFELEAADAEQRPYDLESGKS